MKETWLDCVHVFGGLALLVILHLLLFYFFDKGDWEVVSLL